MLATGDQQDGRWVANERPEFLNYEYRNGFRFDDFRLSAELYRRIRPDLMISGHWLPRPVTEEYLDALLAAGTDLANLHRELLPLESVDFGAGGFGAKLEPYRSHVRDGASLDLSATVRNPFRRSAEATVRLVTPAGWAADPSEQRASIGPLGEAELPFALRVPAGISPARRARVAVDLTVDGVRFGQQAEALVTVR